MRPLGSPLTGALLITLTWMTGAAHLSGNTIAAHIIGELSGFSRSQAFKIVKDHSLKRAS